MLTQLFTKIIVILLMLVPLVVKATSETTADSVKYWTFKGESALAFSQVSLSNWAAGGENSMAANAAVTFIAEFKKGNFNWNNYLGMAYGSMHQQSISNKKTDDKIDLASKLGVYAFRKWDYTLLVGFKSQFADGFNYPNDSTIISRFMAPGYIQMALGMDYKPCDFFSLFMSPMGARYTIVKDTRLSDLGAFGVDKATYDTSRVMLTHGSHGRWEAGASVKALLKRDFSKNLNIGSKVELLSNYLGNPFNVVVNWEVLLSIKANSFLTTTIGTQLIYDDNIMIKDKNADSGPRTQFKEVFGVGLSYKFAN